MNTMEIEKVDIFMELILDGNIMTVVKYDADDHERVSKHKWFFTSKGYVATNINGKSWKMHKFITNYVGPYFVDHVNRVKSDNRKENLRILNFVESAQNRDKVIKDDTTSEYKGVTMTPEGKYRVSITHNYKRIDLGRYHNEIDAAKVFDKYVTDHKLFQPLNFPDVVLHDTPKKIVKASKTSKFNGVSRIKNNRYLSCITICKKSVDIYRGKDEQKAAELYDDYIVVNNVFNKPLNFPNRYPDFHPTRPIKTKYRDVDEKTIQLLLADQSVFVTIDKQDYDLVKYHTCSISKGYVALDIDGKKVRLNRLIMNNGSALIDHENRNKLDNTRKNLRYSDAILNSHNVSKSASKIDKNGNEVSRTSTYIGVCKNNKKWESYVTNLGKKYDIGRYSTEEEAAKARDLFVTANFPDDHYSLNF